MGKESGTFYQYFSKITLIVAVLALGWFGMAKNTQAQDCTPGTCGTGGAVPGTCIEPPPTLVHWWTCDNLNDFNNYPFPSGARSLTLVKGGNASLTPGFNGNACTFTTSAVLTNTDSTGAATRVSDVYLAADDPSLNPGDGSYTVETWVNASTLASSGIVFIRYGFNANGGLVSYSLSQGANGTWLANVGDGVTQVDLTGPEVEPNEWHHLALVIERNASLPSNTEAGGNRVGFSTATMYYDGVLADQKDISLMGSINPSGFQARMGDGFLGSVDELSLYNSALNAEAIGQIFTAQGSGKGKIDRDLDGCSDCRNSACDYANLETPISYQGNFVANPVYAANAATADLMTIRRLFPRIGNLLAVAVTERTNATDPHQTPSLASAVFTIIPKLQFIFPVHPFSESCNICAQEQGLPAGSIVDCSDLHGEISFACRPMCCHTTYMGYPNCITTQPFGLGCKEMTRAEITAGGTCKDTTSSGATSPFPECCPYPPNATHPTVTSGQITTSISGNSIFISDSAGCCIRTGGCKFDSTSTDSTTDNFIHNYYYDTNNYCNQSPKPTGCP